MALVSGQDAAPVPNPKKSHALFEADEVNSETYVPGPLQHSHLATPKYGRGSSQIESALEFDPTRGKMK